MILKLITLSTQIQEYEYMWIEYAVHAYILKAKEFAESAFQSKKIAEKVRKSLHQNFATKVCKSLKKNPKMCSVGESETKKHVH